MTDRRNERDRERRNRKKAEEAEPEAPLGGVCRGQPGGRPIQGHRGHRGAQPDRACPVLRSLLVGPEANGT